jgi:hypothetical protein
MQVDESRGNDQAASIELLVGAAADFIGGGNLGNAAVAQQNVHRRVHLRGRVDDVAALKEDRSRFGFVRRHSV